MAHKVIGHCKCPLCGFSHQEIRLSEKNNKPYMVCDECGMQLFARQARSCKLLNDGATADVEPPAKPSAPVLVKPAQAVKPAPVAPPPAAKQPEEKTIFDVWPFKSATQPQGE